MSDVMRRDEQVIADAKVQRQLPVYLPVVLEVGFEVCSPPVSHAVAAGEHTISIECALCILLDLAQEHVRKAIAGGIVVAGAAAEIIYPLGLGAELLRQLELLQEESKLERV